MKQQVQTNTINDESRRKFVRGLSRLLGGSVTTALLSGNALAVAMTHSITSASTLNSVPTTAGKIFTLSQLKQLQSICKPPEQTLATHWQNTGKTLAQLGASGRVPEGPGPSGKVREHPEGPGGSGKVRERPERSGSIPEGPGESQTSVFSLTPESEF